MVFWIYPLFDWHPQFSLNEKGVKKVHMMMITGRGTHHPTLTSLHGWPTTQVTVVDFIWLAVLRVAIGYRVS